MSKSTDVNGVKTVWSKGDRWSGSSSELANFIKWLKDHAEGDIMSYFYLHIMSRRTHLQGEWSGRSVEESGLSIKKEKASGVSPLGDTPLIPGLSVHRYWAVYISPMSQLRL